MEGNIIDHGHYELLESERGRILLVLNQVNTYLWSNNKAIEYISLTEGMNEKSGDRHFKILNRGTYFIINTLNNTIFNNIPHLYLEHNNHYDEFVLQSGMPNLINNSKEIIRTNRLIAGSEMADFTYQKY
jgi:hypothetical protein